MTACASARLRGISPSQHDVTLRLYLVEDATKQEAGVVQFQVLPENADPMWLHNLRSGFGSALADEPADTSHIANIVSPLVSFKAQLKSFRGFLHGSHLAASVGLRGPA